MVKDESLEERRSRCQSLLADESLCSRLPDKGARIREELSSLEAALANMSLSGEGGSNESKSAKVSCEGASSKAVKFADPEDAKINSKSVTSEASVPAPIDGEFAEEMGRKYGDQKLDLLAELRETFGGAMSEAEIQRMASDAAESFPTFNETAEFARHDRERRRDRLLSHLRVVCNPNK